MTLQPEILGLAKFQRYQISLHVKQHKQTNKTPTKPDQIHAKQKRLSMIPI